MADQSEERWDMDEASTRRVRQSEALLVQLYRDAVEPESKIPAVRGLKIIVFASLVSMVLFAATLFFNYNTFVMLHEDVLTKDGNLHSAIQRRSNLFSNLVKLTLNHAALEHAIYSHTAEMRTEIIKKSKLPEAVAESIISQSGAQSGAQGTKGPDFNKVLEALSGGQGTEASLGRLLAVVEQYPNVRSSETYKDLMSSLVEMEDRIVRAREEYNNSARMYNTAISKFPWYMMAKWVNFDRAAYFDGTAAAGPGISPELYQQLFPLVAPKGEGK
ncbi:MAG: LemA family protein [Alphaproteobacteria bacterium]|nr:LemA family protein [Alphaproteobacteria bacterium]MBF0129209.1 LemA family protein [Alphaproteobacteria bacterium]